MQIRYLWIDSLCIFQDEDKLDWLRESQLMHQVYSYAVLNIAAVGAVDSSRGLFFQHCGGDNTPEWPTIILPRNVFGEGDGYTEYFAIADITEYTESELESAPLNQRAWFQQERWLARRTLYYTQRQLYWACRSHFASEQWPFDHPLNRRVNEHEYPGLHIDMKPDYHELTLSSLEDQRAAYQCWGAVCERYSASHLTYPSDKMVALAGLAQCVGRIVNDTYVAGMWRRNLAQELLWEAKYRDRRGPESPRPCSLCRRPPGYRAPTFSWTSVDGPVRWHATPLGRLKVLAEVVDVRTQLVDGPYGPLMGGMLRLRGPLRRVRLDPASDDEIHRNVVVSGVQASFQPFVHFDTDSDEAIWENDPGNDLYCMLAEHSDSIRMSALLLRSVGDHTGRYRRAGLIQIYLDDDSFDDVTKPQHNISRSPCVEYDSQTDLCTVDIE